MPQIASNNVAVGSSANSAFVDAGYIKSIAHLAAPYGACKIIPPESFRPECVPSLQTLQTKLQTVLHQVDDFESGGIAFQTSHRKVSSNTLPPTGPISPVDECFSFLLTSW
jgi:hypothetical protein